MLAPPSNQKRSPPDSRLANGPLNSTCLLASNVASRSSRESSPSTLCAYQPQNGSVQLMIIRSEQDLWRAAQALSHDFVPGLRFQGWPVMTIRSTVPIDGIKSALAVVKIQDAAYRLFSLMKYGTRSLRRLTALDRERARLGVSYHDRNLGVTIDFTNVANACVDAVESWGEHGPYDRPRQRGLFAVPPEEGKEKESWARTARVLGSQYIAKAPTRDLKVLGMLAIFATAVAWTSGVWIKEKSKSAVEIVKAGYEHQVKMAELERTVVTAKGGEARPVTPQEVKAIERDLDDETRRVMALASDEIEQPLLRFVMNEVERTMPPLMDMAPELAAYSINSFDLSGRSAVAVGKAMRKNQSVAKKRMDTMDGWEPQIHKTKLVTS